jgi:hypothetical protein
MFVINSLNATRRLLPLAGTISAKPIKRKPQIRLFAQMR